MGKKKANQLGRALIKDRFGHGNRKTVDNNCMLHTTEVQDGYDWGRLNLQSVTEESSFQEFLRTAELAGTEFQAEKLNISYVNPKSKVGLLTNNERVAIERMQMDRKNLLKIPRRPKWIKETTPEELQSMENANFLEWRRGLASLQEDEGMLMTPYEKNLDFWRQLWRVVERSDIVVQIVDARNPLLFRSEDLERYVKEVDEKKINMILINKSDFLNDEQRASWAKHFDEQNIRVAFFSAAQSVEEAKKEQEEAEAGGDVASEEVAQKLAELSVKVDNVEKVLERFEEKIEELSEDTGATSATSVEDPKMRNNPKILTNTELIALFKSLHQEERVTKGIVTVGLVGYPNVGKSSTINAVFLEKKTSVSATPGKTKHFQTLFVDKELMFCDCPGLVMPSFCATKADMILNGILPIDQMRDHVPPVNRLCTLIPRHVLEDTYGIMITKPLEAEDPNRPPYSEELLLAFAYNRGYMTANGQPDQSRGSRYVLKDFVNGKLLYCHAPPGAEQNEFHKFPERKKEEVDVKLLPPRQQRAMKMGTTTGKEIDEQFFQQRSHTGFIKGRSDFPHVRPMGAPNPQEAGVMIAGKPWKGQKREKREKLRRKYAHLDQH
ncbi:large subunit GTPase 1 homolog [Toxorhynchites rutilus septentrionalis]|uniref:large subunit GTPase 1 homolog n=1 Tax=Toxorhynchites rutilus septentrionalis TaxID=329112 RepID=UPI00247B1F02|nr:large subunit GTPase 1 homolog [Toxorhynchites rutilus septentrionalis]